jgi:repressor LexA
MAKDLTDRQREVFEFIRDSFRNHNCPPTVREIAKHFQFSSPKAATDHLNALERKGYIRRRSSKARNIELPDKLDPQGIPILGRIAAGSPVLAVEDIEDSVSLNGMFSPSPNTFALEVNGASMEGAGILDGDYVVVEKDGSVKNGSIAVALLGDEATVKRVFFEKDHVRLEPENPDFAPIHVEQSDPEFRICGPVRGVIRRL